MNIEDLKKRYITDKKSNDCIDIRKYYPDVICEIRIDGDLPKILTETQIRALAKQNMIKEYGYDGETEISYIKLFNLFSAEEIMKKIKKIGEEYEQTEDN